jgi:predicted nucleic acid-binding protein
MAEQIQTRVKKFAVLDSSALVKLAVPESGANGLLTILSKGVRPYVTDVSLIETMGVLKRRWVQSKPKERADEFRRYHDRAYLVLTLLRGGTLKHVPTIDMIADSQPECERLSRKYEIDMLDAFQLVSIKQAFELKIYAGESAPFLISADRNLSIAARNEGIKVESCHEE